MAPSKRTSILAASAVAAVFAVTTMPSADAQQRKSLRWTTSQVGSYGYTIAASMAKIARAGAGRRIHRHRAALPVADRGHEGRDGWRRRDRLHRRHRHDPVPGARRPLQGLQAHQARARAHLVRLSDGVDDGDIGERGRQVQVLEGLQRQARVLHAGRLPELAQLAAHLQDARLRLQARADRQQGERRCPGAGHDRGLRDLHHGRPLAAALLEGDRGAHGHQGHQPVSG